MPPRSVNMVSNRSCSTPRIFADTSSQQAKGAAIRSCCRSHEGFHNGLKLLKNKKSDANRKGRGLPSTNDGDGMATRYCVRKRSRSRLSRLVRTTRRTVMFLASHV
jgi:hypothetical protein